MIRPIGEYLVVVTEDQAVKRTESGIVYSTAATPGLTTGMVIESGPGVYDEKGNHVPNVAKKGDVVVFKKSAVRNFEVEGQSYCMIKNLDIVGKIKMPEE